jgi:hypothetical protein
MPWPVRLRPPSTAIAGIAVIAMVAGCQRLPESSTSTSAGSGAASTDDDDMGGTFADESDASDSQDSFDDECNPVTQTGCSGSERCTATKVGGAVVYTCVDDPPRHDLFETCTPSIASGIDGCAAGHVCLGDESGAGLCVALCRVNGDCEQALCLPDTLENIPYCAPDCSPFEASCAAPLQCRRQGNRFSCKIARESDVGGLGSPCATSDDAGCGSGFVCLPGGLVPGCSTESCCTNLCDLSGPDPCATPSICGAVLSGAAPGYEDVGACFVPA